VRLEGASAVVLAEESDHIAADVVRESLHEGLDLTGTGMCELPIDSLELLAPLRAPGRILCVGLNYGAHAAETGRTPPEEPMQFAKFSGSIADPGGVVSIPGELRDLDYEAELAVITGRLARSVSVEDALQHVLGYTVANDVSARAQQAADRHWWRAKGADLLCPLGPVMVTTDELGDAAGLRITTTVNGELRQDGTTSDLVFSVPQIVAYVSRFVTLEPGDLILTGTPSGSASR